MTLEETIRVAVAEGVAQALKLRLPELVEAVASKLAAARPAPVYLTVAQAAELAKLDDPKTIRRWVAAGLLTRHMAGRELRIRQAELEQLLSGGRPAPRLDAAEVDELASKLLREVS